MIRGLLRRLRQALEPSVAATPFRDETTPTPAEVRTEREEAREQILATYGAQVLGAVRHSLHNRKMPDGQPQFAMPKAPEPTIQRPTNIPAEDMSDEEWADAMKRHMGRL